ncbi:MAG: Trm112 family protein [Actinomycetales bacterium]|nr:Trm112 family protein [Actinomycetales bacterium]
MATLSGRPAPLGIPADLWDVLACPCPEHAPVEADEARGVIVCTACARTFEVRDGIPVMLIDEAADSTED